MLSIIKTFRAILGLDEYFFHKDALNRMIFSLLFSGLYLLVELLCHDLKSARDINVLLLLPDEVNSRQLSYVLIRLLYTNSKLVVRILLLKLVDAVPHADSFAYLHELPISHSGSLPLILIHKVKLIIKISELSLIITVKRHASHS